ncbi:hypothetical protein SYJ56_21235 [Algoriphagus sp. D3-2-R+10]|uniref:hypothetical protein n=1 Tax=Algoriphagus aurantiacus TaxID=3103948 RepID=UPI002B3D0F08|nr:hypothetical protein [Algoriphagus sp. D3-2-R+10]MEB2777851.1 hypothetical protein [Algoriphagus sp. D3-2-R+10]
MASETNSTAKFIIAKNNGSFDAIKTHSNWRQSWFQIIPGSFVGGGYTDLLFYDRVHGEAKVYGSDGKGNITLAKHHKAWAKSWDIIVPGKFLIGPNLTSLFLYDRSKGEAKFLFPDNNGGFKTVKNHTGWRKSWDIIVPFDTGGAWTGLLLYDRTHGEGKFFSNDGKGNLTLIKHYTNWKKNWDIIVPGNFGKNILTNDLLFYRRVVGEAKFFSTDVNGKMTRLAHHTNWSPDWDILLPLGSSSSTKLLCYNRADGLGVLSSIDSYNLKPIKSHKNWNKTWALIISGHFSADTGHGLLFYRHGIQLKIRAIKCADDNGTRMAQISVDEVNEWIDAANKAYAPAGVQFDHITMVNTLKNTTINKLAPNDDEDSRQVKIDKQKSKDAADAFAKDFPGEIVIFFRYGRNDEAAGGGFSSSKADYVAMPGFSKTHTTAYYQDGSSKEIQNIKLLAHELGHYLGLDHTFVAVEYGENSDAAVISYLNSVKSKTLDALDGDRNVVRDTPPDVGKGYFLGKDWNPADSSREIHIQSKILRIDLTFNPDRHNVMSYFNCDDYYRLTKDQCRRIQEFLHGSKRKHLL